MAGPQLPATLPNTLSPAFSPVTAIGIGSIYSVGIGGIGFVLSTLDQESPFEFRSYEVQALPRSKPRIDDAEEPGEQTLFPWWARAQHSWHEGAGQEVFDSPFSSRFRYERSKGINPWEIGEASLLKDTAQLTSYTDNDIHLLAAPNALFYTHDGNVERDPDPDASAEANEATLSTHSGTPINSITSDGESLYAAFSGVTLGVKKTPLVGALAWSDVNVQTEVEIIAFVKGRLLGAKTNSLYEYDLAVTTAPEPFYTDRASGFRFTAITESGPAIYISGAVGDRSEILAARLTAQDIPFASVATLGAPRNVWTAPEGEKIHTIRGYIGQQVLIGTSLGVRIGTIVTDEGDLRVSQLIVETPQPVLWFEPQLEFAWFGWSNYDSSSSGLGRVHLGDLAYASDLMFAGQAQVKEVVQYNNRMYWVHDEGATARIIKEHATNLVPSGRLQNCEIRFGTTERKVVRFFDNLITGDGLWSLELDLDGSGFIAYSTDNLVGGYTEEIVDVEATRFCVALVLKPDPGDATSGPTLKEWRLRAEPKSTGRFRYLVPVMVYDFVTLLNEREEGKIGKAWDLLKHLEDLYRSDQDFFFQTPETSVPGGRDAIEVRMEDLRFKSYAPPAPGGRGFGGIALAVMREVR